MTLGVAMIAKNGAATMIQALTPFLEIADEISIVMGGVSDDSTLEIAKEYATVLSHYHCNSDSEFHFGRARQLSFDELATDWIVVVDCDDVWTGVELLPGFIAEAEQKDAKAIYVYYTLSSGEFYQPRIFKNGSGQWEGAVHEQYKLKPGTKVMKTSDISLSQVGKRNIGRADQNIVIGLKSISQNPNDLRAIAHLIKDYVNVDNRAKALELSKSYIKQFEADQEKPGQYDSEYLGVLHTKAECELLGDDYEAAASTALKMLQVKESAAGWAVFAESCQKMANGSKGLLALAIYSSDKALFSGKPRNGQLYRPELSGSIPCLIKAMALHDLGNDIDALKAADLGIQIEPDNKHLQSVQSQLAEILNEAI